MSASDYEYSDTNCPKCGSQMATRRCSELGCEDGEIEDDDGLGWVDIDRCDTCKGTGHEEWCRSCGWDNVYKQFLSPQYEAEWTAKQAGTEQMKSKRLKRYYILERHNPQLGVYYVACGPMTKTAAKKEESPLYGSNVMYGFDTEDEYNVRLEELRNKGERVQ